MAWKKGMLKSVDRFAVPASMYAEMPVEFLDAIADEYGISPNMDAVKALVMVFGAIADDVCDEVAENGS